MKEKWLTTREAAAIKGISLQAVKKNVANGKYVLQEGKTKNGQTGYLIALSSLGVAAAPAKAPAEKPDLLTGCSEKQKAEAFARMEILGQWERFARDAKLSQDAAAAGFLAVQQGKYSRTTLYRWKRDFAEHGVIGLIPNWSNGKDAFSDETFPEEAKLRAQQLFLSPARPSYMSVFDLVLKEAMLKNWPLPSYDTVKRFLQAIPLSARVMLREGRKAFDDKSAPAILRDMSTLAAMEIIESDHHQVDVAVVDKAGDVFFPWLTIWYDVRSRKPLGWILSSTPNSDGIRIAFMKTIMEYGVPKAIHIDNGKDYRAKMFRGGLGRFKAEETEIKNDLKPGLIDGIYGSLGIKVHWAIPYNAKTKVIERFFRTFRTEFSVWFRGYRGKNTSEKPEILNKQTKTKDVFPFDDFKLAVQKWVDVEYCENRKHQGLEMRTPNQVFAETRIEKRTVRDEELLWLCSQYPRELKVGRNGIYFMNDYYWSEKLACEYLEERVLVRYNDNNLSRIFVVDMKGVFIGMAEKRNPGTWDMKADEYRKHTRLKKAVRESVMPYVAIAKSFPPEAREKHFLSLIQDDGKRLPAVAERRVDTPFSHIIEEDRKNTEARAQAREAVAEFGRRFATIEVEHGETAQQRAKREADAFLLSYRRET
jgi:transposase InsO family protein